MKKLLKLTAFLFLSGMLFIACDDDDDDNDDVGIDIEANYFPTVVDNYRVYQNYEVENEGEARETTIDSNVVESEGTQGDNTTYTEKEYEWNAESMEYEETNREITYYEEEGIIYASAGFLESISGFELDGQEISLPLEVPSDLWTPIFNTQINSNWEVFTNDDIVGESIQIPGFPSALVVSEPLTINGKNEGFFPQTVNGEEYDAMKVVWEVTSQLELSIQGQTIQTDLEITVENYFADGIGLIKSEQIPLTLTFSIPGFGEQTQDIPGQRAVLIRHNAQVSAE